MNIDNARPTAAVRTSEALLKIIALTMLLIHITAQAATGPEVAQQLNTRYQKIVSSCTGAETSPAFFCSGVLLRSVADTHRGVFWTHDETASKLGAESFAFLRDDVGTRALENGSGFIFTTASQAEHDDKPIDVLCAYPFALAVQGNWPDHGCRSPSISTHQQDDLSSCSALGVIDSATWLANFRQQGSQPERQCSLSSQIAGQFAASLQAHQGMGGEFSARPNELMVKNWNDQLPSRVPVEAFFYDVNKIGSLIKAQDHQRDYFNATGYWLPVLQLDLGRADRNVFGFRSDDQLSVGFDVTNKLNARYADTRRSCEDGRAAFYCNGVLIRGANASEQYHAWNPSPSSINNNAVSFSYLRADVGPTVIFGYGGFIFKALAENSGHSIDVRCAFPFEAGTSLSPNPCTEHGVCEALGVTRFSIWVDQYPEAGKLTCAFTASAAQFQLSIDVRAYSSDSTRRGYNEILLATWPQDIPLQLPLEAFFYRTDWSVEGEALQAVQFIQRDYFNVTGRFLPIVRYDREAIDEHQFSYVPQDQNAPGKPRGLAHRPRE